MRADVNAAAPPLPRAPGAVADATLVHDAARLLQPGNADRLQALLDLLREREVDFALQPVPNPRQERDSRAVGYNVVAAVGDGPGELLVGAHFDAARLPDGSLSPGMVDNAAGAVVLARVACALREHPLRHRVRFVWFDLEEAGMIGSRHFVEALDERRPCAVVNVDHVGYGDTLVFGPGCDGGSDALHRTVWEECARQRVRCVEFPRYPVGDELRFRNAGVPAVSIGMLPEREAHQLWLAMNGGAHSGLAPGFAPPLSRIIHSPADLPDRLEAAAMARVVRLLAGLVRRLDGVAGDGAAAS